jgi:hypothetical protein
MAAIAGIAPIFQVIGGIASVAGMFMGMSSQPQMLPPPAAPTPEPAPVAPVVTEAKDVAVDSPQRAAQMDNMRRKRAKEEENRRLMTLAPEEVEQAPINLTESLLGD